MMVDTAAVRGKGRNRGRGRGGARRYDLRGEPMRLPEGLADKMRAAVEMTLIELRRAITWLDGEVGTPLVELTVDLRMTRDYGAGNTPEIDDVTATVWLDDVGGGRKYQQFTWVFSEGRQAEGEVRVRGYTRRVAGSDDVLVDSEDKSDDAALVSAGDMQRDAGETLEVAGPVETVPVENVSLERVSLERVSLERVPLERVPLERVPLENGPVAVDADVPSDGALQSDPPLRCSEIRVRELEAEGSGDVATRLGKEAQDGYAPRVDMAITVADAVPQSEAGSRRLWRWIVAVVLVLAGAGAVWVFAAARDAPFGWPFARGAIGPAPRNTNVPFLCGTRRVFAERCRIARGSSICATPAALRSRGSIWGAIRALLTGTRKWHLCSMGANRDMRMGGRTAEPVAERTGLHLSLRDR